MLRSFELLSYLLQIAPPDTPPNPWSVVLEALPNILSGAVITLQLTIVSIALGLALGSLLGIARLSPVPFISIAARVYIEFFRGTPLLVQIFMIHFGVPPLVQSLGGRFSFEPWISATIALSLNSAAYIAEVVRAGIQSIEIGQREASQSLGLGPVQTMRYVIFPQAFRRMLPAVGNDFISLLKDTSLVATIGFEEAFRRTQIVVARTYLPFQFYFTVALIYLVMTLGFSYLFSRLEGWMNPVEQAKKQQARQSTMATE